MRITVIGAGIIGLATGWRLHADGHEVTLLDPAPGSGATYAAGGMLTPVAEAYHGENALTALLLASARRYTPFVEEVAVHLARETPTGFVESGTLIAGVDAADRGHLGALHELCLSLGLHSEQITTREARRLEPLLGPHLTCAFLAPDDHQVDPRLLAAAIFEALVGQGVTFVAEPAARVDAGEVPVVTTRSGRRIEGDVVVVANGLGAVALQGDLGIDLGRVLRPVHGEVLRLRASEQLRGLLTHTVRGLVAGRPVYVIPRGDGRILLGASSREDNSDGVNAGGIHDLLDDAIRLVPAVREFTIDDLVSRARPGTPDNAPLIGSTAPGVIVADGFFRHGILLAPIAADVVAAHVRRLGAAGARDGTAGDTSASALPDDDLFDISRCADPHRFAPTADKDTP